MNIFEHMHQMFAFTLRPLIAHIGSNTARIETELSSASEYQRVH
jgi:hypothetical protein